MKTWEDWYCLQRKEKSIHLILNSLIERHA